ncbi:protein kinase superfamily protein [Actinidia rufa]|uniref:Protein kinase superfamily protein n=1 Tax=Actinidia rufa TaxID=165716 RepID=A0A7J0GGX0_9ERIC|nr:protein kinase superfamily protein [Actinidia rufa]
MGCTQAKHSTNSPPWGLQKLKMENGYVIAKYPDARRSTARDIRVSPGPSPGIALPANSGRLAGGGGEDGKLITREANKDSGGGNILKRMASLNLAGERELGRGPIGSSPEKSLPVKKVRSNTSEPESVKFMAREIMILQKLDHPIIVKLEGSATSRMQYTLCLVFDYMQSDLARIISRPNERLTEPRHCHDMGICSLHWDIKGSNLLIDKNGMLKIGDFGLANYFDPTRKRHLTSRVVMHWYRAPELLLGDTDYGVGINLWSAGCLMAEMFAGRPIMPGRTEVEQLHRIFKLCGTLLPKYWKRLKIPLIVALQVLLSRMNSFAQARSLACDLPGLPVIYKEEVEPMQTVERRRHRNPKMWCLSRTLQERQKKDLTNVTMEQPKVDFGSAKEEAPKSAELNLQQGSSSTSTSSSIKHTIQEGTPLPSLFPNESSQNSMSPNSEAHPNATNNIKSLPPLPNA